MVSDLGFLEEAISDVGSWSWWTADLPHAIQIEFSHTLLWNPPLREGGPPNGQIALRFINPSFVAFLSEENDANPLPTDWPVRLQNDEIEPFGLSYGEITLSNPEALLALVARASQITTLVGTRDSLESASPEDALLGFWAGPVGLIIVAQGMAIESHNGSLTRDEAEESNGKWWAYWKEYWKRKDTENPMPRDFACEVTIPATG